jgi:1-acyl-sn-glycerol-3-phosphate acyltransferase
MTPSGALFALVVLFALCWLFLPPRPEAEVSGINKEFWWWLNHFYCKFWHRLEVVNSNALPEHGPVILISNHTCCIDHLLLQASTRRVLGFLIAKEYFDYWIFRPFCRLIGCIPVRRDGKDLAATRAALRALAEGRCVPIFPEGRILPTSGQEIGEGKPGASFIALHSRAPVIPAYIRGSPATNMIVPSLITPSHVTVTFGSPVDLTDLLNEARPEREKLAPLTDRLMGAIHALRDRAMAGSEMLDSIGSRSPRDAEQSTNGHGAVSHGVSTVVGA